MHGVDPRLGEIRDCLYRVSLKAVIVVDNKLLMTKELSGCYNLPGGGLDYHEEIKTALLRELEEEVGLKPSAVTLVPQPLMISNKGLLYNIPWMNIYYSVEIPDAKLVREVELKFKWVTKSEFIKTTLSPAVEKDRDFLLAQLQSTPD